MEGNIIYNSNTKRFEIVAIDGEPNQDINSKDLLDVLTTTGWISGRVEFNSDDRRYYLTGEKNYVLESGLWVRTVQR